MKLLKRLISKKALALIVVLSTVSFAEAQISNSVFADTISENTANGRRAQVTVVNYSVNKLMAILQTCADRGVTNVQFVFAIIRGQDTAAYFSRHNVESANRRLVVGKSTILLRVRRADLGLALNEDPLGNQRVQNMIGGGFSLMTSPYGGIPYGTSYIYFDSGSICPPPDSCD